MSKLVQTCLTLQNLDQESLEALESIVRISAVARGKHLLYFGEVDRKMHFVAQGSGRVYYERDGRDITDYLALDGHFLGAVESLFTQKPSNKAIEILEDSIVESIDFMAFENLCVDYHLIERLGRKLAIFGFLEVQQRMESIRFKSAAERYAELEELYPGISNRVPLKHLASFLGTSQVSLSRIRAGVQ